MAWRRVGRRGAGGRRQGVGGRGAGGRAAMWVRGWRAGASRPRVAAPRVEVAQGRADMASVTERCRTRAPV